VIVQSVASIAGAQILPTYSDVQFLSSDRTERLDVYMPAGLLPGERYAGIVFIHGGAWVSGGKSGSIEKSVCSDLALAGFVCISIDYKLATSSDPSWPVNLRDCKTAVQFLRVHADDYQVDADHIGAMGWSAGGHLSLLLGMLTPEDGQEPTEPYAGVSSEVQVAVSMYGITNLETWSYTSYSEQMLGASYSENPALWIFASPVSHVTPENAPVLFLHGTADDLVPISQSEELVSSLDSQGVENILYPVQDAYHYFDLQPSQEDLRPVTVAFLNRHLRPHLRPDFDLDGDIDQSDFGRFQTCLSGPTIPPNADCLYADLDLDNDVDHSDFGFLQRCFSGPDIPVSSNCAD
jgi:acetyl esterase/lipase